MSKTTWKPSTTHGELSTKEKNDLPETVFAFPKQRKEPLTEASHVRNALARFNQVKGVTDEERDLAFANIKKAAEHYEVEIHEKSWNELGKKSRRIVEPPSVKQQKIRACCDRHDNLNRPLSFVARD